MTTKEDFIATCQALRKNDPCLTKLNLAAYGSLLDCGRPRQVAPARKRIQQVAQALEENTFVEELTLSEDLCVDSILQFSHFMRTSPSLRHLEMRGKRQGTKEEELKETIMKSSIVFESITRSSSLVILSLRSVLLGDQCPLEGFLSSTRTLLQFSFFQSYAALSYPAARAIGRGLAQNKSLVKLSWEMTQQGFKFLEEIMFGLGDHTSLKTLELRIRLTESSSQALRSLLHYNGTLESLSLTQLKDQEKIPTMVAVLAGLAENTGLKEVSFGTYSGETNATLATAWTDMLQKNTSITKLNLMNANCEENTEYGICSAVAEGLVENSTLETLHLPDTATLTALRGPVWQEALESNHCLRKLCLSESVITLEGFECLARGLSHNTSLESIDLSYTNMTDDCVIALVDGLRTNKTLKCLDLSSIPALGQSGRVAIERLMGYNVLKELLLANASNSVGASILTSGLSENHSLEKLDLQSAFLDEEGSETFRALCESLRGNTTLRHLDVGSNGVRFDGVCAGALKLNTMCLETLELDNNPVTSCGIAALAHSLQRPCSLKTLNLMCCDLNDTGLLMLGEALITNFSLEVLEVYGNDFTHNGACQFVELLPQMKGLREMHGVVVERSGVVPTEAVGTALLDGLRKNTKLQKIFADDHVATVESYFPPGVGREINFYLSLNRHGRMLLRPPGGSEPPSGLWPRVLANITGPRNISLLFYFLQNKPKLVKWNAPANRKRKASESPSLG
jgi:Ran GTPase-activating protein (RanGAP) involved in mRNA processing and transport